MSKLFAASAVLVLTMLIGVPIVNAENNDGGEVIVNTGQAPCSGLSGYDIGEFLLTGDCKCPPGESAYNDQTCVVNMFSPPPPDSKPPPVPGPGPGNNGNEEEVECEDCLAEVFKCMHMAEENLKTCMERYKTASWDKCAMGVSRDPGQYGKDTSRWGTKAHTQCMKSHIVGVPGTNTGSTAGGWNVNGGLNLGFAKVGGGYTSRKSNKGGYSSPKPKRVFRSVSGYL